MKRKVFLILFKLAFDPDLTLILLEIFDPHSHLPGGNQSKTWQHRSSGVRLHSQAE